MEKWLARYSVGGGGASHDAPKQSGWIQTLWWARTATNDHNSLCWVSGTSVAGNRTFPSFQTHAVKLFFFSVCGWPRGRLLKNVQANCYFATHAQRWSKDFYQFFLFTDCLTPVAMSSESFLSYLPLKLWRNIITTSLFLSNKCPYLPRLVNPTEEKENINHQKKSRTLA